MNCPNCKSKVHKKKFLLADYTIVRCLKCNIMYNLKILTNSKNYKKNIFNKSYYFKTHKPGFLNEEKYQQENPSNKLYSKIFNFINRKKKINLLDVGCAHGSFINFVNKNSKFKTTGIDISSFAIKNAKKKGLNVKNLNLNKFYRNNKKKKYELITFWDVLEHVDNVDENFRIAKKMIKKKGYIFLITDIYDSLIGHLSEIIYKCSFGLIKYPIYKFFIKQNSVYFEKKILFDICKKHKLNIIYNSAVDHPIERINLNFIEFLILKILYFFGNILKLNSQIFLVLQSSGK